jgi:hypothetical protein
MGSIGNMPRSLRSNNPIPPPPPSAQSLFNNIRKEILNTHHSVDLEFPDIPPDIGLLLTRSLDEDAEIERALPRYVVLLACSPLHFFHPPSFSSFFEELTSS